MDPDRIVLIMLCIALLAALETMTMKEVGTDMTMWTEAEILVAAQAMLQRQTENTHTPLKWSDLTPNSQAGYISDARCAMEQRDTRQCGS
jgi:hypothetical protein